MPVEILTMLGGVLTGGILKLWGMSLRAKAEQQKALIERATLRRNSTKDAREYKGNKGFDFTKRTIALSSIFAIIVFPIVIAPFFGIEVTHGWTEWNSGFLFFTEGKDVMVWKTATGLVITPLHTHLVAAISGLYFGSSVAGK